MKRKILLLSLLSVLALTGCGPSDGEPSNSGVNPSQSEQENLKDTVLNAIRAQLLFDKENGSYCYNLHHHSDETSVSVLAHTFNGQKFVSASRSGQGNVLPKDDDYFEDAHDSNYQYYAINDNDGLYIDTYHGIVDENQYKNAKEDLFSNLIFPIIERAKENCIFEGNVNSCVFRFDGDSDLVFSTFDNDKKTALSYQSNEYHLNYSFLNVSTLKSNISSFEGNPFYKNDEEIKARHSDCVDTLERVVIDEEQHQRYNNFLEKISLVTSGEHTFRVDTDTALVDYKKGYFVSHYYNYIYHESNGKYAKYLPKNDSTFYKIDVTKDEYTRACDGAFILEWINNLSTAKINYHFYTDRECASISVDNKIYEITLYSDSIEIEDFNYNKILEFRNFDNEYTNFVIPTNYNDLNVKTYIQELSDSKFVEMNIDNNNNCVQICGDAVKSIFNNNSSNGYTRFCVVKDGKVYNVPKEAYVEGMPLDFVVDVTGHDEFCNLDYQIFLDADNYIEDGDKYYFNNKPEFNLQKKYGSLFADERIEVYFDIDNMQLSIGDGAAEIGRFNRTYTRDFSCLVEKCKDAPVAEYNVKSILETAKSVFTQKTYSVSTDFDYDSDYYNRARPFGSYCMYESDEAMFVGGENSYCKFDKTTNESIYYSLEEYEENYYIQAGKINPKFITIDELYNEFMDYDLKTFDGMYDSAMQEIFNPFDFYFGADTIPGYEEGFRVRFTYKYDDTTPLLYFYSYGTSNNKQRYAFENLYLDTIYFYQGNIFNTDEDIISAAEEKTPINEAYRQYLDLKNASFNFTFEYEDPIKVYPNGFTYGEDTYIKKDENNFDKYVLNKTPGSFGYNKQTVTKGSLEDIYYLQPYYLDALEYVMNNPITVYYSDDTTGKCIGIDGCHYIDSDNLVSTRIYIFEGLGKVKVDFEGRHNGEHFSVFCTITDIGNDTLVEPSSDAFDLFLTEFEVLGNFRYDVNATVNANVPGFGGNPGFNGSISNSSFAEIDKVNNKFHKETTQIGTGDYASQGGYQEIWGAYTGTKYEGYVRNLKGDTPQACVVSTSQSERILNLEDEPMMQVILNKNNFVIDGENNKLYHLKAPVEINYNGTSIFIKKCDLDFSTNECLSVTVSGSDSSGFITYTAIYQFSKLGLTDPSYKL